MPPSRAMAIAMRASVTLSIAADTSGTASVDVGGERRRGVDRVGQHLAVAGDDDHVVERERLEAIEEVVVVCVASCVCFLSCLGERSIVASRRGCTGVGSLDQQAVLGGVDPWLRATRACRRGWIGTVDGGQHRPVVDAFVGNEVDHHAGVVRGPARASCHARSMASTPGSSPGSAGWRLIDLSGEPAEEAHRQDPHPAGEHDPGPGRSRRRCRRAGRRSRHAVLAGVAADVDGRHAGVGGPLQGAAVGLVRHDRDDLGGDRPSAQASRIACRLVPVAGGQHDQAGSSHESHDDLARPRRTSHVNGSDELQPMSRTSGVVDRSATDDPCRFVDQPCTRRRRRARTRPPCRCPCSACGTARGSSSRVRHLAHELEQRRHRPRAELDRGVAVVGQHARQVLGQAATGDVGERLDPSASRAPASSTSR